MVQTSSLISMLGVPAQTPSASASLQQAPGIGSASLGQEVHQAGPLTDVLGAQNSSLFQLMLDDRMLPSIPQQTAAPAVAAGQKAVGRVPASDHAPEENGIALPFPLNTDEAIQTLQAVNASVSAMLPFAPIVVATPLVGAGQTTVASDTADTMTAASKAPATAAGRLMPVFEMSTAGVRTVDPVRTAADAEHTLSDARVPQAADVRPPMPPSAQKVENAAVTGEEHAPTDAAGTPLQTAIPTDAAALLRTQDREPLQTAPSPAEVPVVKPGRSSSAAAGDTTTMMTIAAAAESAPSSAAPVQTDDDRSTTSAGSIAEQHAAPSDHAAVRTPATAPVVARAEAITPHAAETEEAVDQVPVKQNHDVRTTATMPSRTSMRQTTVDTARAAAPGVRTPAPVAESASSTVNEAAPTQQDHVPSLIRSDAPAARQNEAAPAVMQQQIDPRQKPEAFQQLNEMIAQAAEPAVQKISVKHTQADPTLRQAAARTENRASENPSAVDSMSQSAVRQPEQAHQSAPQQSGEQAVAAAKQTRESGAQSPQHPDGASPEIRSAARQDAPAMMPHGAQGVTNEAPARTIAPLNDTAAKTPARVQDDVFERVFKEVSSIRHTPASVDVTLSPESLGRVTVNVGVDEGRMAARINVQTNDVKQMMEAAMPKLQEALQSNGIMLDSIAVFVNNGSSFAERRNEAPKRKMNGGGASTDETVAFEALGSVTDPKRFGYSTVEYIM